MASIEHRGNRQWRAKVRRKGYPVVSETFTSKSAAEAWARGIESDMDRTNIIGRIEGDRVTLVEALDRYEREVTPRKKGAKVEKYRIEMWRRDPLSEKTLASIRSSDLAAWRDRKLDEGFSASKIRNDLNLVSHLFNIAAAEWGYEGLPNPMKTVRKPSLPQGRDRRLGVEEEALLFATCRKSRAVWLEPIIVIALETGMRLGEIMSLQWERIDLEKQTAHLPDTKNSSPRNVPLSKKAVATLEKLPHSIDGRVFPTATESVKSAFSRIVSKAKIKDLRFHDLRHEATSRLFEKGLDMMEVASITGHKTLSMLRRYTHLKAEHLAQKLG